MIGSTPARASDAPAIRITNLGYTPGGNVILDGFDLELARGGTTAFVGASGCGKSTLLRLIAGLRTPTAGQVVGTPERRAYVFQDHALLPWLTLAQKLPHALSGGQRMRGSIARALYAAPEIVFLDEAFSALDGITRAAVQADFQQVAAAEGWTVLMVTHDLLEATTMADRVVALRGPPLRVVYDVQRAPASHFEAGLPAALTAALGAAR